ncbi:hypothetical protein [Campylobacter geochelonis]|uniref:Uncharacterized protein n=1 Tax=Campylobacter geochelonis TaxID=1780362 RepID=A0A128EED4_9BACT|nr:hypothetical protein [Campylobacter geochelonis]QKF71078.1 hypothetical protein CGEO_0758 [Campylobacter geochelonis]CZE47266.1 Uncharacterised protein [Campylobacter geochelonis]CZE50106.1 Uncharacterised protein [Campylobacter geochelonis]
MYRQQQIENQIAYQNFLASMRNTSNNMNMRNALMKQSINSLNYSNQNLLNQQRQQQEEYNIRMQQWQYNNQLQKLNRNLDNINNTLRGY